MCLSTCVSVGLSHFALMDEMKCDADVRGPLILMNINLAIKSKCVGCKCAALKIILRSDGYS